MIAINGYKMPKDCVDCVMQMGGWCGVSPAEVDERVAETVEDAINNGKPDWCPLVEIDAEPVRHGRWNYRHEDDWCYCTACGTDAEGSDGECLETDYCPHCGAKMDERGADNG